MFSPAAVHPKVAYDYHRVVTEDGAVLQAQSTGEGPAVLLANGIGVSVPGLDVVVEHLRHRYRCVLWDYRGLGESRLPDLDADVSMPRHAADGLAVLDALGIERAAVLGWSMGVQVGLEIIRAAQSRVTAFGALFGAHGRPFQLAFPAPFAAALHALVHGSAAAPWGGTALLRLGASLPPVAWFICNGIGFVGDRADRDLFHRDVQVVSRNHTRTYFRVLVELMHHDASDMLPTVACPTLVAAGTEDWVTPPEVGEAMAAAIPGARLLILPETSHFGVIEHGPDLLTPVDELLAQVPGGVAAHGAPA